MTRIITALLLVAAVVPAGMAQSDDGLPWIDDLGAALRTAKTARKPVMVLVYDSI